MISFFFFFNDTATTEIYTLSLHDALPISALARPPPRGCGRPAGQRGPDRPPPPAGGCPSGWHGPPPRRRSSSSRRRDRKSTRLNSSHANISYAVFCLKKKKNIHPKSSILY